MFIPFFPPDRGEVRQWNPAVPLALSYRRRYQSPTLTAMSIRAFSNHTVFSGLSVCSIYYDSTSALSSVPCLFYLCRQVTEVPSSHLPSYFTYSHIIFTCTALISLCVIIDHLILYTSNVTACVHCARRHFCGLHNRSAFHLGIENTTMLKLHEVLLAIGFLFRSPLL